MHQHFARGPDMRRCPPLSRDILRRAVSTRSRTILQSALELSCWPSSRSHDFVETTQTYPRTPGAQGSGPGKAQAPWAWQANPLPPQRPPAHLPRSAVSSLTMPNGTVAMGMQWIAVPQERHVAPPPFGIVRRAAPPDPSPHYPGRSPDAYFSTVPQGTAENACFAVACGSGRKVYSFETLA